MKTDGDKTQAWFFDMLSNHKKFMRNQPDPLPIWLVMRKDGKDNFEQIQNFRESNFSPNLTASKLIAKNDPDRWILFAEGWAKVHPNNKKDEINFDTYRRGDIEKLPDKLETLTAIGKNREKTEMINKTFWIIRNDTGKIIDFKNFDAKIEAIHLP